MPSKKPHWDYTEDYVAKAILEIIEYGMLVCKAGEKWGIPKVILRPAPDTGLERTGAG